MNRLRYAEPFQTNLILNEEETRALGRILLKEWINSEDEQAHAVVNKIFRTINDMDSRTNNINK